MNLDPDFYPALRALAHEVGVPPSWFLLVFYLESGLDPRAHRAGTGYYGLNQMNVSYLQSLGVDPATYLTWPASAQVKGVIGPWYASTVRQYNHGQVPTSPGVLYAFNLAPGVVALRGNAPSTILYAAPSQEYAQNQGLDVDHSGTITISDLDAFLAKKAKEGPFRTALAELGVETSLGPSVLASSSRRAPSRGWLVAAALVLGVSWFASRAP